MGKRETSFLGAITMQILRALPQADAGWLIQALVEWIIEGKQPNEDDIPETCLGAWIAIREESIAICETRKARAEAGRVGGSKPKQTEAKPSKPKQTEAKPSKPKQTEAEAEQTEARARAGLELEKELEYTDGVPLARAPEREEDEPADNEQRTAVDLPPSSSDGDSGDDRIKHTSFDAWARLQPDPVAVALEVTGEGKEKKGIYGKRLRKLGKDRFLDVVCGFRAQVAAGETVRNPGAALTAQLNEAIEAKDEIGRLAQ